MTASTKLRTVLMIRRMMERLDSTQKKWQFPFFSIWTGQQLSLIGSRVAQFALVWWLTDLTGSATVLATASMVALLPEIVLGPIAGVYVDRWKRRTVMVGSLLSLTSPVGLAVAGPVSDWLGLRIWYLAGGLLASMGGVAGFFIPALVHVEENHIGPSHDGERGRVVRPAPAAVEVGD